MKKRLITTICTGMLLCNGCTQTEVKSAEGLYSGCSFIIDSGDYYNIGIEVHYQDGYSYSLDHTLNDKFNKITQDLVTDEPVTAGSAESGTYYCTDVLRSQGTSWRKAVKVPKSAHDQLAERMSDLTFTLTLESRYSTDIYQSEVNLPLVDMSEAALAESEEEE